MMASLLSLAADYLLYSVCMVGPSALIAFALLAVMSSSLKDDCCELPIFILHSIAHTLSLSLKNFWCVVLISESHCTLPSLACYLVCPMIGMVMFYIGNFICCAALDLPRGHMLLPDWMFLILWSVTLVVMDMVLSYSNTMATLLSLVAYLMYMVALSCPVLVIAIGAIQITKSWWPELVHTSIVALTLLLLNMMWGSPFEKPTSTDDPNVKSALVGYLIYIVSSMAVSCNFFGLLLLLRTFVISLTFVLLHMFLKPSSVSEAITTLVGLSAMIAMTLMALLSLLSLSFVVFMFIHTWVEMMFPSACRNYPPRMFVRIIGLTFMSMKIVLDIPVEIFSDMKAGLIGITDMINGLHGAYVVIRNLTILAVPLLSMESRQVVSLYKFSIKAAFIVTLGLLLTMPPGLVMSMVNPAFTLVSDDFVQQMITSFFTSLFGRMDGETKQLTDS